MAGAATGDPESEFLANGFAMLPRVVDDAACDMLRALVDVIFAEPLLRASGNVNTNISACRLFELNRAFLDLASHPLLTGIARSLLGEDFHLIAQNVLRTRPGQLPFSGLWHTDEPLLFPLPDDVPGHPENIRMPVYWIIFHIALSDIGAPENGPTQYVPSSHYSGRRAPRGERPEFRGNGPVAALVRRGGAYMHNSQCWHRATMNTSGSTRYLLQNVYGAGFVTHWFQPYVNYQLPGPVTESATPEQLRLLGMRDTAPFR
jgi:ectoine hydroxylase-related dioxygenase (phytanoyl-CoA dioxygenase family)